mmetsp:Transcript_5171/g.12338  ORF Transcript_5171/g.12338 Transcript_5171/m.12338 type:complete len:538 (-) Transcript_5171:435-2048(-)
MSKGTAKSSSPEGKRVTLGSWALNAERRNLKSPVATRQSVIARRAAFWSCFWWLPTATVPPPEAWRPPATFQACRRLINTSGWQLTTTSTSGTATANARFLSKAPDEKPVTSASGTIAERAFCTRAAKVLTARSLLGVADNCKTSSSTCAAQDWAFNSGPATGFTVCVRTKPREVAEEFPGDDEGFAAAAAAKAAADAEAEAAADAAAAQAEEEARQAQLEIEQRTRELQEMRQREAKIRQEQQEAERRAEEEAHLLEEQQRNAEAERKRQVEERRRQWQEEERKRIEEERIQKEEREAEEHRRQKKQEELRKLQEQRIAFQKAEADRLAKQKAEAEAEAARRQQQEDGHEDGSLSPFTAPATQIAGAGRAAATILRKERNAASQFVLSSTPSTSVLPEDRGLRHKTKADSVVSESDSEAEEEEDIFDMAKFRLQASNLNPSSGSNLRAWCVAAAARPSSYRGAGGDSDDGSEDDDFDWQQQRRAQKGFVAPSVLPSTLTKPSTQTTLKPVPKQAARGQPSPEESDSGSDAEPIFIR